MSTAPLCLEVWAAWPCQGPPCQPWVGGPCGASPPSCPCPRTQPFPSGDGPGGAWAARVPAWFFPLCRLQPMVQAAIPVPPFHGRHRGAPSITRRSFQKKSPRRRGPAGQGRHAPAGKYRPTSPGQGHRGRQAYWPPVPPAALTPEGAFLLPFANLLKFHRFAQSFLRKFCYYFLKILASFSGHPRKKAARFPQRTAFCVM